MEPVDSIRPASRHINVLIVVDTDQIIDTYGPNCDPCSPIALRYDRPVAICTDAQSKVYGQGTSQLKFLAHVWDMVSVSGVSSCGNAHHAVLLYSLLPPVDGHVFAPAQPVLNVLKRAVEPDPDSPQCHGLPPLRRRANFSRFSSTAQERGVEPLAFSFALYRLEDDGGKQMIFGYYRCHFVVTVI